MGVPGTGNRGFWSVRRGHLEAELGTPGRLKERQLDRVAAGSERDLPRLLIVTLRPIPVDHKLAGNAEPGPIVGGEIEGIERVTGHAEQPGKTNSVVLGAFVTPKSHLGYGSDPERLEPPHFVGRSEAPFHIVIHEAGLEAFPPDR